MARVMECPKCGRDISDTHEDRDPDVGINSAGWYCEECDEFVSDEEDDEDFRADYIVDHRKNEE
jgi:hypothetical protein